MSSATSPSKRSADEQLLSDVNDVPSDSFCSDVSAELDTFQQSLLDSALQIIPEADPTDANTKKKEALEKKLEQYTHASEHGVEVPSMLTLQRSCVHPSCTLTQPIHHFSLCLFVRSRLRLNTIA